MNKLKTATSPRRPNKAARPLRTRGQVKRAIAEAFRDEFPTDTVDVSDGYEEFIHVLVVSRRFDPMTPREKQNLMWRILGKTLDKSEIGLVSLLLPISPSEIK